MENNFSNEQITTFDRFIKSFLQALKNCTLYDPGHTLFNASVERLYSSIQDSIEIFGPIHLGITQENILLSDNYVREGDPNDKEAAGFLHERGVMAIAFIPGLRLDEIHDFMDIIRGNAALIRKGGGVLSLLGEKDHIKVKDVDYSSLLGGGPGGEVLDEEEMWAALCGVSGMTYSGDLPESSKEFMNEFLLNPGKSANMLNRIYKAGKSKIESGEVKDMTGMMKGVIRYFSCPGEDGSKEERKELAGIISKLDPALVSKIFSIGDARTSGENLAKKLTRDFDDNMLGDFIGSLIMNHGGINENLFKLFSKIIPDGTSASNIATMASESIIRGDHDKGSMEGVQRSIKEVMKSHPDNEFMSQMYKITVDVALNGTEGRAGHKGESARLIEDFENGFTPIASKTRQIRLILNLIWLERDPLDTVWLFERVKAIIPDIIVERNISALKDIVYFFFDKILEKEDVNEKEKDFRDHIAEMLKELSIGKMIIACVKDMEDGMMDAAAYISSFNKLGFQEDLVNAYIFEKEADVKCKYLKIFEKIGENIFTIFGTKINSSDLFVIRNILEAMGKIDPVKADNEARRLMENASLEVKTAVISRFKPESESDYEMLLDIFGKEKDESAREEVVDTVIKGSSWKYAERLIEEILKDGRDSAGLLKLIKMCGRNKIEESVACLEKILNKENFFNPSALDEARIASAVSLGEIKNDKAVEALKRGSKIKREKVRNMCDIVLKMGGYAG